MGVPRLGLQTLGRRSEVTGTDCRGTPVSPGHMRSREPRRWCHCLRRGHRARPPHMRTSLSRVTE